MEGSNEETGGTPLQSHNEDVSAAVHITGGYLPFAVEALWFDREIVLAAVNTLVRPYNTRPKSYCRIAK